MAIAHDLFVHRRPRAVVPERMDDPAIEPADHAAALRGLRRLNRLSRAVAPFRGPFDQLVARYASASPDRPLRLIDVACGAGETPIALVRRVRGRVPVEIHFVDASARALEHARAAAEAGGIRDIVTHELDVTRSDLPLTADFVMTALFLHHLPDEATLDLVLDRLTRTLRPAGRLVVTDLVRGPVTLGLVGLAARLVSRSPVVHHDAVCSVRAAFRPDELAAVARRVGLRNLDLRPCPPARMRLIGSPRP